MITKKPKREFGDFFGFSYLRRERRKVLEHFRYLIDIALADEIGS